MTGLDLRLLKNQDSWNKKEQGFNFSFLNKELAFSNKRLDDKSKENFFLEFHSMISSGITVKMALELIIEGEKKIKIKEVLKKLLEQLIQGDSFSHVLKNSELFSPFEYYTIKIGEETGKLQEVALELANHFSSKVKQKRQFISAITYPIVLIFISLVSTSFLLLFMIPMFEGIFARFGGELPWVTKMVLLISNYMKENLYLISIIFLGILLLFMAVHKQEYFRKKKHYLLLKIPVIGSIYFGFAMIRFCKSMKLLISSKLPLNHCITLMKDLTSFYPLKLALPQIELDLFNGMSLHQSLAKIKVFDSKTITMIKIGEEVHQLEKFFNKIGENYSQETEFKIAQMNSLMEPLMIIILGLIIGLILVTMYLPMFQLSTSLSM